MKAGHFIGAILVAAVSTTASAQTINWVYANGYAKNHPNVGVVADEFIGRLDKATNGRLKVRHVAGGTLLKPENMLEGLRGGIAQMGSAVVLFFPGQLPISATLAGVTDLDTGNKIDAAGATAITMRLLSEVPEFATEYEKLGLKAIMWVSAPPYGIIGTKPIAKLQDFQGKKIRAFGSALPKLLTAAGAAPVSMAYGEIYTSLQTGVIDGAFSDVNGMTAGKFEEVAKHMITTGPKDGALTAIAAIVYMVNLEEWKKLPAGVQKTIEKVAKEMTPAAVKIVDESAQTSVKKMEKAGVTFRHLSQAETDALAKKIPNVWEAAAKTLSDAKLPGDAIVRRYREIADSYIKGTWKP
jgi:TRAP-type C4-dicarboxylate transport system substrate-binding protein